MLLAMALLAPAAYALQSDRAAPIELEADRAELDQDRGTSIYQGNVHVTQGSLELTADSVSLERTAAGDRMLADGTPAPYTQTPDAGGAPIRAKALHIEHLGDQQLLILTGDAELVQGQDTFRSERIVYDIEKNLVKAGSTKGDGAGRVRIVIQPKDPGQ